MKITKEKIYREIKEAISESLAEDSKLDVPIWNKNSNWGFKFAC